jgi:hypothetical protein
VYSGINITYADMPVKWPPEFVLPGYLFTFRVLEPYAVKVASTVLRRERRGNPPDLSDFAPNSQYTRTLPTRAQEFGGPSLQPSLRRQTHAFLPARTPPFRQLHHAMTIPARLSGLCHLDNFIKTGQILPVCRDFVILTTLS